VDCRAQLTIATWVTITDGSFALQSAEVKRERERKTAIHVPRDKGKIQRNILAKLSSKLRNQFANKRPAKNSNSNVPDVATALADIL
jgi:hypothetical protein